MGKNCLLPVIN